MFTITNNLRIQIPITVFIWLTCFVSFAVAQSSMIDIYDGRERKGGGTVIKKSDDIKGQNCDAGYVVTAWHAVRALDQNKITVRYSDGQFAVNGKVVAHSEGCDVALILVGLPPKCEIAKLSEKKNKAGDILIWNLQNGPVEAACSLPTKEKNIFADLALMAGDSGRGVFTADGNLAGVVSGGWFWLKDDDGKEMTTTWPARAGAAPSIRSLLNGDKEKCDKK